MLRERRIPVQACRFLGRDTLRIGECEHAEMSDMQVTRTLGGSAEGHQGWLRILVIVVTVGGALLLLTGFWNAWDRLAPIPTQSEAQTIVFGGDLVAYETWDDAPRVVFRHEGKLILDRLRRDSISIQFHAWPSMAVKRAIGIRWRRPLTPQAWVSWHAARHARRRCCSVSSTRRAGSRQSRCSTAVNGTGTLCPARGTS